MPNKEVEDIETSVNHFDLYNNRLIGSIKLKKLDIVGTDIKDTTKVAKGTMKLVEILHGAF